MSGIRRATRQGPDVPQDETRHRSTPLLPDDGFAKGELFTPPSVLVQRRAGATSVAPIERMPGGVIGGPSRPKSSPSRK